MFAWWLFVPLFAGIGLVGWILPTRLRPFARTFLEIALVALVGWTVWLGYVVFGLDARGAVLMQGLFLTTLLLLPVTMGRVVLHAHMLGRTFGMQGPQGTVGVTSDTKVSIHVP